MQSVSKHWSKITRRPSKATDAPPEYSPPERTQIRQSRDTNCPSYNEAQNGSYSRSTTNPNNIARRPEASPQHQTPLRLAAADILACSPRVREHQEPLPAYQRHLPNAIRIKIMVPEEELRRHQGPRRPNMCPCTDCHRRRAAQPPSCAVQ